MDYAYYDLSKNRLLFFFQNFKINPLNPPIRLNPVVFQELVNS